MEFFINGVWIFIGVVAGALIQFVFHWMVNYNQKKNAKKLLLVEIEINRKELDNLSKELERKKDLFTSGQFKDTDFGFNLSSFIYRIVDPLINSGHFHIMLDADGVKKYFQFANELHQNNAANFEIMLREQHGNGTSVSFFNWILNTKMSEWHDSLSFLEDKLR